MLTTNQRDHIFAQSNVLFKKGCEMFGIDPAPYYPGVSFDLRGTAAGQAGMTRTFANLRLRLRYNTEAFAKHWDDNFRETIPHEIAHLVIYILKAQGRSRDRGHGRDWKRVCLALGGTAKRCHNYELTPARVRSRMPKAYLYRTPSGRELRVTAIKHRRIQHGQVRVFRDTKEQITASHFVGIVS